MNLSIFDVDGIGSKTIDKNEIKTFIKNCHYVGKKSHLVVEAGEFSKGICDDNAVIVFKLNDEFNGADWTINVVRDNRELELIFKGGMSCNAFIQALEFAVSVLKEAKARAEYQKSGRVILA